MYLGASVSDLDDDQDDVDDPHRALAQISLEDLHPKQQVTELLDITRESSPPSTTGYRVLAPIAKEFSL